MEELFELEQKLERLRALEHLVNSEGWKIFTEHLKQVQESYLKKARDKRIQFAGDKIALFMACEGLCDELGRWPHKELRHKETILKEIQRLKKEG